MTILPWFDEKSHGGVIVAPTKLQELNPPIFHFEISSNSKIRTNTICFAFQVQLEDTHTLFVNTLK